MLTTEDLHIASTINNDNFREIQRFAHELWIKNFKNLYPKKDKEPTTKELEIIKYLENTGLTQAKIAEKVGVQQRQVSATKTKFNVLRNSK